jgi:Protein of unknown function (DUF4019)
MSGYGAPPGSYGTVPNFTTPPAIQERRRKDRKILVWSLTASAIILTLLLWRCGTSLYRASLASDAARAEFHKRLNSEQYHEIYAQADRQFRNSASEEDITSFLRGVHEKLGNAGDAKRQNIVVKTTPGGTYATVIYETKFTSGSGTETYVWRLDGERLLLVGYNLQSRDFFRK